MCANCDNLEHEVAELEAAGASRLHLDVMDGQYVPNFALGLGDVKSICRNTSLETELHMMILEPGRYIQMFADAGVDFDVVLGVGSSGLDIGTRRIFLRNNNGVMQFRNYAKSNMTSSGYCAVLTIYKYVP